MTLPHQLIQIPINFICTQHAGHHQPQCRCPTFYAKFYPKVNELLYSQTIRQIFFLENNVENAPVFYCLKVCQYELWSKWIPVFTGWMTIITWLILGGKEAKSQCSLQKLLNSCGLLKTNLLPQWNVQQTHKISHPVYFILNAKQHVKQHSNRVTRRHFNSPQTQKIIPEWHKRCYASTKHRCWNFRHVRMLLWINCVLGTIRLATQIKSLWLLTFHQTGMCCSCCISHI